MPGCMKESFDLCKPVVILDGCHQKGVYNRTGIFLTATLKDGSNHNLLVALAIVRTESKDNWILFLERLNN